MPDYEIRLRPLDEFRKLVEKPGQVHHDPGEEISDKAEGVPVHMNATNIEEAIEPAGGKTVAETIENNLRAADEQAQRTGKEILVHFNHPNFGYAITAEEIASVLRERFVEVYNGHPGVHHEGGCNARQRRANLGHRQYAPAREVQRAAFVWRRHRRQPRLQRQGRQPARSRLDHGPGH